MSQDTQSTRGEMEQILKNVIRRAQELDDFKNVEDLYLYKDSLASLRQLQQKQFDEVIGFDDDVTIKINPASDEDLVITLGENANNRLRAQQRLRAQKLSTPSQIDKDQPKETEK